MNQVAVKELLNIYSKRKEMQEDGIISPSDQMRRFTADFVEILRSLPLDDKIVIVDKGDFYAFYDNKETILIQLAKDPSS